MRKLTLATKITLILTISGEWAFVGASYIVRFFVLLLNVSILALWARRFEKAG